MFGRFERWLRAINKALVLVSLPAYFVAMALIIADVVGRSVFSSPIQGVPELSALFMVIMVYGGIAFAQTQKAHLGVSAVVDTLSLKTRAILKVAMMTLSLVFFITTTWQSFKMSWDSWVMKELAVGAVLPTYSVRFLLALGLTLLCLQLIVDLFRAIGVLRGRLKQLD